MEIPFWQLHRGYWVSGMRENTLQAFYAARRLGVQMVELDVQLSGDKVPVVYHDETLDRFFHIKEKVSKTKFEDLEALNIPSLEEVLKSSNVPSYINIELKSKSLWPFPLVKRVASLVKNNRDKMVLFSSFNPLCLWWAKKLLPEVPRALLVDDQKILLSWKMDRYRSLAEPHYLNVHESFLDDEICRDIVISQELPVVVWTVNDLEKAKFYLQRGAVSIISDQLPPK